MTRDDVNRWLERYVAAWKSNDPAEVGDLFAEDAVYRYDPADPEPMAGREAIVQGWLSEGDEPGSFDASYACWALDGDRAVALGTSTYEQPERRVYDNVFLLVFDGEGRCAEFTDVYLKRPQPS
jgi:hypothetical protein